MVGQCWLTYLYGIACWFIIPLTVVFLIARLSARRNWKKVDEYYQKSWAKQEEMISLLKEIRDSVKKDR